MRVRIKASTIGPALVLAIVPLLTNAPIALALAPPNDDFADAEILSGPLPLTVTGTTVDASSSQANPTMAASKRSIPSGSSGPPTSTARSWSTGARALCPRRSPYTPVTRSTH